MFADVILTGGSETWFFLTFAFFGALLAGRAMYIQLPRLVLWLGRLGGRGPFDPKG